MGKIILEKVNLNNRDVKYYFSVSEDLKKYFKHTQMEIQYQEDISKVPISIISIPFIANVLPMVMLTDSEIYVEEIDEDFYDCIPDLANGYSSMFPESKFLGHIKANRIINNANQNQKNRVGMFFSGGVDSVYTLVSHANEKPDLISIWGSDIKYDNKKGWNVLQSCLSNEANNLGLELITIKSSFREFDDEHALDNDFQKLLKDGWWHGVKHGIALLGHVAPIAFLRSYSTIYIASSNTKNDKNVRCASNPLTDNAVRFCGAKISHDGFEACRQEKVRSIVKYCNSCKKTIQLHVCWEHQSGSNCCLCEKCCRTILSLLVENANPVEYGFTNLNNFLDSFNYKDFLVKVKDKPNPKGYVYEIAQTCRLNRTVLRNGNYWKSIKWLLKINKKTHSIDRIANMHIMIRRIKRLCLKLKKLLKSIIYGLRIVFTTSNKTIFLLGVPLHNNIGDLAITIAEQNLLKKANYKYFTVTTNEVRYYFRVLKLLLKKKTILLHGGGNMGDVWYNEESLRRRIITQIKAKKYIIMPQTLYYSSTSDGVSKENESIRVYNKSNVTLLLRDEFSYDKACKLYPNANKYLACDTVLTLDYDSQKKKKNGKALLIFRSDVEKSLDDKTVSTIEKFLKANSIPYDKTDMYSKEIPDGNNNNEIVLSKLDEISSYNFVITDRLHGMIFSTITSTTCFAFNNSSKKVEGTYNLIKSLGYVSMCNSYHDFIICFNNTDLAKNCLYDKEKIKFYCEPIIIKNIER